uniref:C2H2-type domain-containing protein n=1 Tax=Anopheles maculatus TaxID=74869 RepID=A0A182T592_9DIPT
MQFLRPVDGTAVSAASAMFHQQQSQQVVTTAGGMSHPGMASPAYITLPITMPGAKPGDAQQTVQIQVLNPNPLPSQVASPVASQGQTGSPPGSLQAPKFQMGQMQIPIQGFQQGTTVLTVAYSPQDEEVLHNQGLPEGMTIVAALQPQDLQLLASQNPGSTTILQQHQQSNLSSNNASSPGGFGPADSSGQGENGVEGSPEARMGLNGHEHEHEPGENGGDGTAGGNGGMTPSGKARKKRKYKTKPPKPKRQKPGQVHIATAIDGTVLFCCPECHMAYPEKECLEQHLVVHKIERRFICDICGAGLKRKEHLERHKLGHNPERPFICNVCEKGFKRKEHLNLHYVIHSGVKTEICNDCGKGFYRKDHLRKHIKSHVTKRLKEEKASNRNNNNNNNNNNRNTTNGATNNTTTTTIANGGTPSTSIATLPPGLTITTTSGSGPGGTSDTVDAVVQSVATGQQSSSTQNLLQSAISLPQGVTIHVSVACVQGGR